MYHTTYSQNLLDREDTAKSDEVKAVAQLASPVQPSVYKGFVMHQRLEPKQHRFNHAFYFYTFDLTALEELQSSVVGFGYNRKRPVSIHDKDYINPEPRPIISKLRSWLTDNGYATDFQTVKLVTSPRHFNYVFNPVSFYLCYDKNNRLKTVVAEVNNTFKERHLYVAENLVQSGNSWIPDANIKKDFHVSPFNTIDGDYAFKITDNDEELRIGIDIIKNGTPVFYSELYGTPTPMTSRSVWKTILRYPLRPALTFPRILLEAAKLYLNKKLPVRAKPTPVSAATISTAKPSLIQRAAMKLVLNFFTGIHSGRLHLTLPNGEKREFGETTLSLEEFANAGKIHVRDYRFFTRILFRGSTGLGEAYVDEYWQSDNPASALIPMAMSLDELQKTDGPISTLSRIADSIQHKLRKNTKRNSRKNIQDHYDLGNDFYQTFLDPAMTYSSGIYRNEDDSLEQSQLNKLDEMITKADIQADHHILEIGSGWGSFAIRAVQTRGCRVTTITLSDEQHRLATQRIKEAGLEEKIEVRICDYRDIEGTYDRIVSIEMLEAVGHEHFDDYFKACRKLLKPDGLLALQVITIPNDRYDDYCRSCDWIQKYIFPGGHLPSVEALQETLSNTRTFEIDRMENIGLDYARTLRDWRARFMQNLTQVRDLGYSESFIRKWEYYLSYCEAGFGTEKIDTQQIVLKPIAENS